MERAHRIQKGFIALGLQVNKTGASCRRAHDGENLKQQGTLGEGGGGSGTGESELRLPVAFT